MKQNKSMFSSLNIAELSGLLRPIKTRLPEIIRLKNELRESLRKERQCSGLTKKGERCEAWAVYGNLENRCFRHGGAETAKIPRKERFPACRCRAYQFPHRQRSGICVYPEKPIREHPAAQGQRRYFKRIRKTRMKNWLKSLGL